MDANDARIEMEANFHKVFYMMADKVDKLFVDYEERMAKERKGSESKEGRQRSEGRRQCFN